MSITQEQYNALKPGDRVSLPSPISQEPGFATVVGVLHGKAWLNRDESSGAYPYPHKAIAAIIPPAPQPVACINFYAGDGTAVACGCGDRTEADKYADADRTHVITIYSDGTTTTEATA